MKKKNKRWTKFRHRVVRNIAFALLYPYTQLKYGIDIKRFKEQGDRPYLILLNHQTPFDQFFVGMAFKGPVYYLATLAPVKPLLTLIILFVFFVVLNVILFRSKIFKRKK